MEEGDDCAFKLFASTCIDCGWGEGSPDNGLANTGCDEQGDTAAETVAFLEKLVEEDNDQTS